MNAVSEEYKDILKEYRDDMVKYAPDKDKPHIRECFNSIPKQLAKENKKFQWSKVKPGGRGETYMGSLQWLEDAGIICRCYNTDITGLPMEGNAKDNVFKVYTADIGLLIEMLGPGTRADILQGNLGGFKGAIFENLMADTLHKKQQRLDQAYFLESWESVGGGLSGVPVLGWSEAGMGFEELEEDGLVGEMELIDDFLDGQVGVFQ